MAVAFEARCFFHAIERVFPWIAETSFRWNFVRDHDENDEKSRVYRWEDEEEYFKVTRVD